MTKSAGEHWVCSVLASAGWGAALTRDGLERTDILAVRADGTRHMIEVQVKTASPMQRPNWRCGTKTQLPSLSDREWFVFVALDPTPGQAPASYVVPRPMTVDRDEALWMREWAPTGIEGIVAKRLTGAFESKVRGWEKARVRHSSDAIVGAVTGRVSAPSSLLLGRLDTEGRLRFIGRTTPLTRELAANVGTLLQQRTGRHPWTRRRFSAGWGSTQTLDVHLVEPELVVEVNVDISLDAGGRWRHPVLLVRARPDLEISGVPSIGYCSRMAAQSPSHGGPASAPPQCLPAQPGVSAAVLREPERAPAAGALGRGDRLSGSAEHLNAVGQVIDIARQRLLSPCRHVDEFLRILESILEPDPERVSVSLGVVVVVV